MSQGIAGLTQVKIDASSIADGASIAAYLVDSAGTLLTSTLVGGDQALDVNIVQSVLPTGAATEATLASILADTATIDSNIALILADTNGILADTATIDSNIASLLSELQSITFAEDSAHSSGDAGIMGLAVRNDAGTSLVSADGDYSPLSVDASGNLRVSGSFTFDEAGDYAEDSAHSSGAVGYFQLGVRNDNQATSMTSANGDYGSYTVDDRGAMYVKDIAAKSNLQQVVTVGTSAVALPASPLSGRSSMFIQMLSNGTLYLGSATVTSSGATRGLKINEGGFINVDVGPANLVYGIANAAGKDVVVWEFA
jgi:hypothetical protein